MCGTEVELPLALEVGLAQQMDQQQVRTTTQMEVLPRVFQKVQPTEQQMIQAMVKLKRDVQPTEQRGDGDDGQRLVVIEVSRRESG